MGEARMSLSGPYIVGCYTSVRVWSHPAVDSTFLVSKPFVGMFMILSDILYIFGDSIIQVGFLVVSPCNDYILPQFFFYFRMAWSIYRRSFAPFRFSTGSFFILKIIVGIQKSNRFFSYLCGQDFLNHS